MTEKKTVDKKLPGKKDAGVSDSEFNMWRAIFACAHADDVVTQEERRFMRKALNATAFSAEQRGVLEGDIEVKQDIAAMYKLVTDQEDRSRFFYFARMLFWCDGDFGQQEQAILTELGKAHFESVQVDKISKLAKFELENLQATKQQLKGDGWGIDLMSLKTTGLELEDEQKHWIEEDMKDVKGVPEKNRVAAVMDHFLQRFKKSK
jgi:hypothetical protein